MFVWGGFVLISRFRAGFGDVPGPRVFPAIGPLSTMEDLVSHIPVESGLLYGYICLRSRLGGRPCQRDMPEWGVICEGRLDGFARDKGLSWRSLYEGIYALIFLAVHLCCLRYSVLSLLTVLESDNNNDPAGLERQLYIDNVEKPRF